MTDAANLERVWFKSPDGETRCCPHIAWGGYIATCKCRNCPRCGRPWARSWETVMREGLREYGGDVALVTITAPGATRLPWACSRKHQHSGCKGCRVDEHAADRWAENAPRNWRLLRDAARKACVRAGVKPTLQVRGWEPQKRGVPHLHLVLGLGSVEELEACRMFGEELARLAPEYDFGFVDRKIAPITAREASSYIAGYLVGRSGRKEGIRENIADPRMPRSLLWVSPTLTRRTMVTMRTLRYVRWYFAAVAGRLAVYPQLFGDVLFEVAAACARLSKKGEPRGPTLDVTTREDTRYPRTFSVPLSVLHDLQLMRRLERAAQAA